MSEARILPNNATPLERALEKIASTVLDVPVTFDTLWHPDRCPTTHLHILALTYSVDVWKPEWPEATKRAVIKAAPAVHRLKGTRAALTTAIGAFGFGIRVEEWFQYGGAPYTFRLSVRLSDQPWTKADVTVLYKAAIEAKNVRSHLETVRVTRPAQPSKLFVGAATRSKVKIALLIAPVTDIKPQRSGVFVGAATRTRIRSRFYT